MQQAPQPVVAPQQSVTVVPATQTVTVITSPPLQTSHLCENYAVKQAYVLGLMQVVIGGLCIILQIAALSIGAHAANSGAGIWCGIVFVVTGVLGITSSRSKGRGVIVACMVMCIISSVLVLPLLISASVGIGHDNDDHYCRWDWNYSGRCPPVTACMVMCIISAVFTLPLLISAAVGIAHDNDRIFCNYYPYYSCKTIEHKEAKIGLNVCLLLLSLLECIAAIWASAVCCNAVCCGRTSMGGVVVANQMPGQMQVVGGQGMIIQQPGVYPGHPMAYTQPTPMQQPVYPQQPAYTAPVPPSYSAEAPPAYNQLQSSAPPEEKH